MNTLEKALVAVVSNGPAWAAPHVEALRAAGAKVRVCAPDYTLWTTLSELDYDAIVIACGTDEAKAVARALDEDAKLRNVPAILLHGPGERSERNVRLVSIEAGPLEKTISAVAALVAGHTIRRRDSSTGMRVASIRPPSLGPPGPSEEAARREIDAGFHDLRVLLGIIVGFGANLRDGVAGSLTESAQDHVLKVIEAAADATVILEQTAVASRTAALGSQVAQPRGVQRTIVDIATLAQSVTRLFEDVAAQRGIGLKFVPSESIRLWGNPVHLKQVIANLVVNALKFTPRGGQVRVGARAASGEHGEIVVADTGPGIPGHERARIFEHGVRLERDAKISGSGIGLAVVRELVVTHHGGSVRVESASGGGAQFVVALPLDRRRRDREGLVVVREGPALERALAWLTSAPGHAQTVRAEDVDDLRRALAACGAVVVLPGDQRVAAPSQDTVDHAGGTG